MDVSIEPLRDIWIGTPLNPQNIYQVIEFETLPAYCLCCHVQGHNAKTCKWVGKPKVSDRKVRKENVKTDQVWVSKDKGGDQPVVEFLEGETSKLQDEGESLVYDGSDEE